MARNHGSEYQVRIVRGDGTEELSGWLNSAEQVAEAVAADRKPQGKAYWVRARNVFCNDRIEHLVSDLSPEQLIWRPRPESWSIRDVLVHLRLTVDKCLPSLDRAIVEAQSRLAQRRPVELGVMGRFFVWYVEPPPRIRLPAPKTLVPASTIGPSQALGDFYQGQQLVLTRMEEANGLDLVRATFKSPFASLVRMNLLALFRVFTAHERRHVWQMNNIKNGITV